MFHVERFGKWLTLIWLPLILIWAERSSGEIEPGREREGPGGMGGYGFGLVAIKRRRGAKATRRRRRARGHDYVAVVDPRLRSRKTRARRVPVWERPLLMRRRWRAIAAHGRNTTRERCEFGSWRRDAGSAPGNQCPGPCSELFSAVRGIHGPAHGRRSAASRRRWAATVAELSP